MNKSKRNLYRDTAALAMPHGRRVGQPGHDAARLYLLGRLEEIGLTPFFGTTFELPFLWATKKGGKARRFTNLVAKVPGRRPELPPILLGAHYDSVIDAPCADDNATSVAVVLSAAEAVHAAPLERDLIVALFDSEEPPYFLTPAMGSTRFYTDYCGQIDFACAIILDLIGHDVEMEHPAGNLIPGVKELLFILGAESSTHLPPLVESAAANNPGLRIIPTLNRYIGDMSDHHAFRKGGEPYLFLSCGQGRHYHQPTDDLEWINFSKVERVRDLLLDLTLRIDAASVEPEAHDPAEFEIRMIRKAIGPAFPLLRRAIGLPPVKGRKELDQLVRLLAGGLGV